ncbi:hypothetical protein GCM10027344_11810 [Spelaeicoccus albus]
MFVTHSGSTGSIGISSFCKRFVFDKTFHGSDVDLTGRLQRPSEGASPASLIDTPLVEMQPRSPTFRTARTIRDYDRHSIGPSRLRRLDHDAKQALPWCAPPTPDTGAHALRLDHLTVPSVPGLNDSGVAHASTGA